MGKNKKKKCDVCGKKKDLLSEFLLSDFERSIWICVRCFKLLTASGKKE